MLLNATLTVRANEPKSHYGRGWEVFTDKVISYYKSDLIDPMTKKIIFSDGLDFNKAIDIHKYCDGKIQHVFGIGTNLTNDFPDVKPLSIVMKLQECDGLPVGKISDEPEKAQPGPDSGNPIYR